MAHAIAVEYVRMIAYQTLERMVPRADDPPKEIIMIRDGYYHGRRFELGGISAVWLVGEPMIDVWDETGRHRETIAVPAGTQALCGAQAAA